jgi:hypothetical protein
MWRFVQDGPVGSFCTSATDGKWVTPTAIKSDDFNPMQPGG